MIYSLYLLWIILSMLFGYLEAKLFYNKNHIALNFKAKYKIDIHFMFTVIRFVVILPLLVVTYVYIDIIESFYLLLSCLSVFPFFHDGMYYYSMNKLSNGKIYKRKWFDQSHDTSAILSFSSFYRVFLLLLSFFFFPF
jgi:hypothetical protein